MKYLHLITMLFITVGCNDQTNTQSSNEAIDNTDSALTITPKSGQSLTKINDDSALIHLSNDIFRSLKNRDFRQFSTYIHPIVGVRFSPYGNIDTSRDKKLTDKELLNLFKEDQKIHWGFFDGTGDSINLDIRNYFRRFVYDADFIKAEKIAVNKFIGSGNSVNNLSIVYPECDFTEFYFSGFDAKYNGKDWKTIRLVFKNYNEKPYLVAIVHDQWTI